MDPIRARRRFAIGGELGWNGLAGLGVNFSYHPITHLAFDVGGGLGVGGWKAGLRLRANLLESAWTPLLGVGILIESGTAGQTAKFESQGDSAMIEVLPSPFLQLVGGVNYTADGGFVFMATGGYAVLLKDENTRLESGSTQVHEDIRPLLGGGIVLSVAFGYAF